MRKWHRWISLFFGIFMLWMSLTGIALQALPLLGGAPQHQEGGKPALSKLQPGFTCPADVMCRPKAKSGNLKGFIQHLHSGEQLGPVGVVISTLTGFALLFFTISGLWMYVQMWRFRNSRNLAPRWLWK